MSNINTTNNADGQLLINRILKCISDNDIQNYSLHCTTTKSEELFFIRQECTLNRNKLTTKCEITIYHDFESNDVNYRGSSSFIADLNMDEEELGAKIMSAYRSSLYVKNSYYPLPSGNRMETENSETIQNNSGQIGSNKNSDKNTFENSDNDDIVTEHKLYTGNEIADFVFKNDVDTDVFINSLEIFVTENFVHIINSNGIDVGYHNIIYSGEFVVQAKTPNDVELYQDFKYSYLDDDIASSLSELVCKNLKAVKDRAIAVPINGLPQWNATGLSFKNVILEGNSVYELFHYYLRRTDASMVYPGYSHFKIGDSILKHTETSSTVTITLNPKVPYSPEGIKLLNLPLISDNTINYITGDARFSYYLGVPATGTYECFVMECGDTSISEIQKEPYLKIVSFSDFQMDEFTGQFGGEYRLAYYFDGKNTIPVTNGSISCNINDIIGNILFSSEKQSSYYFDGPLAISYSNIQ